MELDISNKLLDSNTRLDGADELELDSIDGIATGDLLPEEDVIHEKDDFIHGEDVNDLSFGNTSDFDTLTQNSIINRGESDDSEDDTFDEEDPPEEDDTDASDIGGDTGSNPNGTEATPIDNGNNPNGTEATPIDNFTKGNSTGPTIDPGTPDESEVSSTDLIFHVIVSSGEYEERHIDTGSRASGFVCSTYEVLEDDYDRDILYDATSVVDVETGTDPIPTPCELCGFDGMRQNPELLAEYVRWATERYSEELEPVVVMFEGAASYEVGIELCEKSNGLFPAVLLTEDLNSKVSG